MDVSKLTRDADAIRPMLKQANGKLVNASDQVMYLVHPKRYQSIGLLDYEQDYILVYGIFALVVGDRYMVCRTNGRLRIRIAAVSTFTHNNMDYLVYTYHPDDVVVQSLQVIQEELLLFNMLQELTVLGKIPFFLTYDDLLMSLDHAKKYAGSRLANAYRVFELMVSRMAHDPKNPTQFYRMVKDAKVKPELVGLSQVQSQTMSPFNKIMGNYSNPALISSLLDDSEAEASKIETILRYN